MSSRMGGDHDQPSDAEMEDRYDRGGHPAITPLLALFVREAGLVVFA